MHSACLSRDTNVNFRTNISLIRSMPEKLAGLGRGLIRGPLAGVMVTSPLASLTSRSQTAAFAHSSLLSE